MKRDIICFINNDGLNTFTTGLPLSQSIASDILKSNSVNDVLQFLGDSKIPYSKALYSPGESNNIDVYFIMSTMYESIHERNIYIINCSEKGSKCIFTDKYIMNTKEGFIMSSSRDEDYNNLELYCRSGEAKKYSLGLRLVPNDGCRLEYKLAI